MKKRTKKFNFFVLFSISLILLTSCDSSSLKEDLSSIGEKLIPNIWAFLTQLLAFVVLIIVVIWLGYKPIKKYLNKRQDLIDNEVKDAKNLQDEANKNNNLALENLNSSKAEAQKIVEDATKRAQRKSEIIIEDASREAQKILEENNTNLDREKEKAIAEVKDEIVDVAILASKQILQREVNEEDSEKIVDDFVKKMSEENKNN